MKKIWILAAVVVLFVSVATARGGDGLAGIVRIEVGSRSNVSQEELWRRVYYLEQAVVQLQARVFQLEGRPTVQPAADRSTFFTCYIKTSFEGTFTATEPTEMAARAAALEKCTKGGGGIFCKESDVKCGK